MMNSPGQEVPNMLLEISGEITSERMNSWSQSKNHNPVVDGTSDRSKVRCCKEQYCIGTWNVTSTNQRKLDVVTVGGRSERQHFRNQKTKMNCNG